MIMYQSFCLLLLLSLPASRAAVHLRNKGNKPNDQVEEVISEPKRTRKLFFWGGGGIFVPPPGTGQAPGLVGGGSSGGGSSSGGGGSNNNSGPAGTAAATPSPTVSTAPSTAPTVSTAPSITPTVSNAPSATPTKGPTEEPCVDLAGWTDMYGSACGMYMDVDDPGCPNFGEYFANIDTGVIPNEACCYCKL